MPCILRLCYLQLPPALGCRLQVSDPHFAQEPSSALCTRWLWWLVVAYSGFSKISRVRIGCQRHDFGYARMLHIGVVHVQRSVISLNEQLALVISGTFRVKRKSFNPILPVRSCTNRQLSRLIRLSCSWSTFLVGVGVIYNRQASR